MTDLNTSYPGLLLLKQSDHVADVPEMREFIGRQRDAELHLDFDHEDDVVQGVQQRDLRCVELFAQDQIGVDNAAKDRFQLAQDRFSTQAISPVPVRRMSPALHAQLAPDAFGKALTMSVLPIC
jgi:hypothetical protein